ncbi:MAG: MFS transporter [Candidatus Dormibacter sp.]|uniref:MFS transporter n=1 Tax=Candidatus Dormibacter sp. TaxID=2973982 RepID=UPI000DB66404|nr:MAG: MFS transporter [Candidatus Dormibacteraeota bacterium]
MTALRRLAGGTFGSLAVRNYRLYFFGQVVSVSGSWMQRIAQSWLVLHLTGSGVALGAVSALQFLPVLLLGAWGGLVADRFDKRRVLLGTQAAMGVLALGLALATLSGVVNVAMVYAFALALGFVAAIDMPARQAFVMEMVGRQHITNAVSLNSAVFTSARVIGPALAGVLISAAGTGWCFLINAASFLAVLLALAAMNPSELQRSLPAARGRGQLRAGISYAWRNREVRALLLIIASVGTLALNFNVILPLVARNSFHGDATTFGLLFSTLGLGSLAGALFTASRRTIGWPGLLGALLVFGLCLLGAAVAPGLIWELLVLVPLGVASLAFQATANSTLQLRVDAAFRGRVMALYGVVFVGSTPFGSLLVGWVAEQYGPRSGFVLGGVSVLLTGLVATYWWRRERQRGAARASGETWRGELRDRPAS